MIMRLRKIFPFFLLGLMTISFWSCKDDEDILPEVEPGSNAAINRWISEVMEEAYYWLENLGTPISENSDPEDYFESLLFRPTDRFSVIYPDYHHNYFVMQVLLIPSSDLYLIAFAPYQ